MPKLEHLSSGTGRNIVHSETPIIYIYHIYYIVYNNYIFVFQYRYEVEVCDAEKSRLQINSLIIRRPNTPKHHQFGGQDAQVWFLFD